MSAKERSWFLNSKVTMYAFCKYVKTKLPADAFFKKWEGENKP